VKGLDDNPLQLKGEGLEFLLLQGNARFKQVLGGLGQGSIWGVKKVAITLDLFQGVSSKQEEEGKEEITE